MKKTFIGLVLWLYSLACFAQSQNGIDCGADPTGVGDSTAAMASCAASGKLIYYPSGTYSFSSLLIASGGIAGDGDGNTHFISRSLTTAITYNGNNAPTFRNFSLAGSIGNGLSISTATGAQVNGVTITGFPNDLQFLAGDLWTVIASHFLNYSGNGITIANSSGADAGDSVVMGSWMVALPGSSGNGINYQSGGGLKLIGNKFNLGGRGVYLDVSASANTSVLLIEGDSIEGMSIAGVDLVGRNGGGQFSNIVIQGNELSGNTVGYRFTGVSNFYVGGSAIVGNGQSSYGVEVDQTSANGKIGAMSYVNLGSDVLNASPTVYAERSRQTITETVTSAYVYGPFYLGALYVSFPSPFATQPEVTCYPTSSGSAAISAYPTGITQNGFSLMVLAIYEGMNVPVTCYADGVL